MPTPLTLWRGIRLPVPAAAISLLFAAAACAPTPPREPAVTPSPAPNAPVSPVAELSVPRLTADSATYAIVSHTKTLEESAPQIETDSIVIRERVITRLVPDSIRQLFTIELRSDSGYLLPPDRVPPPETIPKEVQRVTSTATAAWRTTGVQLSQTITPACPATPTLVSQLIPLVLARFVVNAQSHIEATDSIQYSTCNAGVQVSNVLRFSPMSLADSALDFDIISISDSSRALPMHTRGRTSGKATVTPISGTTGIPSRLTLSLDVSLTVSSSIRHQRFRQQVYLQFLRQ